MAQFELDPRMQPPSAQKKHSDEDALIKKEMDKEKLLVDSLDPEQAKDLGRKSTVTQEINVGMADEELPEIVLSDEEWLSRAKQAYDTSTSYFDNNVRTDLDNSIRAFHNQHKSGSSFASATNTFTSKVYRPKTRSALMKYEAAADAAYFSNPDVVSIEAENPSDKNEVLSAAITKALIQYRLTKTIPWYQIVIGGFQDAQVQGLAVAHYYWKVKVGEKNGSKYLEEDKPAIDLIPLENFRFDPNANWTDIVNSSPFLIYLRPMFVCDIKTHMESGYFNKISDDEILQTTAPTGGSTRTLRAQAGQDPRTKSSKELSDYEVVTVQEHIHRVDGQDYVWYTLDNQVMLKSPVPIEEIYFTEERQFVIGQCVIETHNPYSSSIPTIVSGVQEEINEIANQRLNNVKLALNKKFIIKSDSEIDLAALLRNQPGSAVYTLDPTNDVRELSTPDVTQSSYVEQDRLNADFDELVSNFNPTGIQGQQAGGADTWRGMQMLNANANIVLEHQLRIFSQTFIEPILRGLVKLEAKYETDDVLLALIGKQQGETMEKFGVDEVTDEMLRKDLVVKVNVGMGSTDPLTKTKKLIDTIMTLENVMKSPLSRAFDIKEIAKELFANAGYGDGMRFLNQQVDMGQAVLQQENMQLKQKLIKGETAANASILKNRESNQVKLAIAELKEKNDNAKFMVEKAFSAASQSQQPQQAMKQDLQEMQQKPQPLQ